MSTGAPRGRDWIACAGERVAPLSVSVRARGGGERGEPLVRFVAFDVLVCWGCSLFGVGRVGAGGGCVRVLGCVCFCGAPAVQRDHCSVLGPILVVKWGYAETMNP